MRKLFSFLLAACLAAALTACGGGRTMELDTDRIGEELAESELGPEADAAAPSDEPLSPADEAASDEIALLDPGQEDPSADPEAEFGWGEMASAEFSNPLVEAPMPADHAIDWGDEALEAAMRDITGISEGDILLSDVWETVELDLSGRGVTDITALGEMTNLLFLDLRGNAVADLSPLKNLTALSVLYLSGCPAADLTPVGALPYLTELYASGCGIEDLRPLAGIQYLSWVDLSDNEITDIAPLASLMELAELDLSGNPISDVSPLAALEFLSALDLSGTAVTDVSPLAGMTLDTLDLSGLAIPADELSALRDALPMTDILTD